MDYVDLYSRHGWNQIDEVYNMVPVNPGERIMTFYAHILIYNIILIYIVILCKSYVVGRNSSVMTSPHLRRPQHASLPSLPMFNMCLPFGKTSISISARWLTDGRARVSQIARCTNNIVDGLGMRIVDPYNNIISRRRRCTRYYIIIIIIIALGAPHILWS